MSPYTFDKISSDFLRLFKISSVICLSLKFPFYIKISFKKDISLKMETLPQGSNLGPLLFLLYINDLPNCLDTSVPALIADDTNLTKIGATSHDIEMKLEKDLSNVHNWLLANKLTLNVKKTEYMIIGSRQKLSQIINEPVLSIGSESVSRVSSTKTLGVIVDERSSPGEV